MEPDALPRELRPFVDDGGRLCRWPSRQKVQRMAVAYLAKRFQTGDGSRYRLRPGPGDLPSTRGAGGFRGGVSGGR